MSLAVGVDVGGTKIAAGVVDDAGRILDRARIESPNDDATALIDTIVSVVEDLRSRNDITAVGVGAAGFVSEDRNRVLYAPHLRFGDQPVGTRLSERLGLPVDVENDANAAAWAEFRFGAGQGVPDQLMATVGTGVGGGIVANGELYRGGHGGAAEIGHITLVRDGRPCKCGRHGCLEQYASGSALTYEARTAAARGHAPSLIEEAGSVEAIDGRTVTRMAQAGHPDAVAVYTTIGHALGSGLASLVSVLDPDLIVIGGGVSEAGDLLLRPTVAALNGQLTGGSRRPGPDVRLALLGNDAGMVGCADLARISA